MKQAVLATDTLSYVLDNWYSDVSSKAKQYFRVFGYFSISGTTAAENVEGLESSQNYSKSAEFQKYLETLEVLPIDLDDAVMVGQIIGALKRTGKASATLIPSFLRPQLSTNSPLVTNNQQHYQRIVDLGFA